MWNQLKLRERFCLIYIVAFWVLDLISEGFQKALRDWEEGKPRSDVWQPRSRQGFRGFPVPHGRVAVWKTQDRAWSNPAQWHLRPWRPQHPPTDKWKLFALDSSSQICAESLQTVFHFQTAHSKQPIFQLMLVYRHLPGCASLYYFRSRIY